MISAKRPIVDCFLECSAQVGSAKCKNDERRLSGKQLLRPNDWLSRKAVKVRVLRHARIQFLKSLSLCDRVAFLMEGVRVTLKAEKPEMIPLRADTLGAKLKQRRFERGLRQIDVAHEMGVDEHSIVSWEKRKKEPMVSQYPAIIAFLGYEPWSEPTSLGQKLRAQRRRQVYPSNRQPPRLTWTRGRSGAGRQTCVRQPIGTGFTSMAFWRDHSPTL